MVDFELERIRRRKMDSIIERTGEPSGKPITLTDGSFSSELTKHKLMVTDFWAPWCGPCRMVGPIIEELASEMAGKVTFGKMNVDENGAIANSLGIRGIPTMIIFKDGEAVETLVGARSKSELESRIRKYM